jgi:hypothetical protein
MPQFGSHLEGAVQSLRQARKLLDSEYASRDQVGLHLSGVNRQQAAIPAD